MVNPNGASNPGGGIAALHQASDTGDTIQPRGLGLRTETASGMPLDPI